MTWFQLPNGWRDETTEGPCTRHETKGEWGVFEDFDVRTKKDYIYAYSPTERKYFDDFEVAKQWVEEQLNAELCKTKRS